MCVCKALDRDRWEGQSRWEVTLNNGENVYMDDGTCEPHSAWIRLRNYCHKYGLWITDMRFGFRDNMQSLPSNADGYFFCKSARGMWGYERTMQLFIVGTLQNGSLTVTSWKVPEMIEEQTETRDVTSAGECLISKLGITP